MGSARRGKELQLLPDGRMLFVRRAEKRGGKQSRLARGTDPACRRRPSSWSYTCAACKAWLTGTLLWWPPARTPLLPGKKKGLRFLRRDGLCLLGMAYLTTAVLRRSCATAVDAFACLKAAEAVFSDPAQAQRDAQRVQLDHSLARATNTYVLLDHIGEAAVAEDVMQAFLPLTAADRASAAALEALCDRDGGDSVTALGAVHADPASLRAFPDLVIGHDLAVVAALRRSAALATLLPQ
jgi:hypothetical protein